MDLPLRSTTLSLYSLDPGEGAIAINFFCLSILSMGLLVGLLYTVG